MKNLSVIPSLFSSFTYFVYIWCCATNSSRARLLNTDQLPGKLSFTEVSYWSMCRAKPSKRCNICSAGGIKKKLAISELYAFVAPVYQIQKYTPTQVFSYATLFWLWQRGFIFNVHYLNESLTQNYDLVFSFIDKYVFSVVCSVFSIQRVYHVNNKAIYC